MSPEVLGIDSPPPLTHFLNTESYQSKMIDTPLLSAPPAAHHTAITKPPKASTSGGFVHCTAELNREQSGQRRGWPRPSCGCLPFS